MRSPEGGRACAELSGCSVSLPRGQEGGEEALPAVAAVRVSERCPAAAGVCALARRSLGAAAVPARSPLRPRAVPGGPRRGQTAAAGAMDAAADCLSPAAQQQVRPGSCGGLGQHGRDGSTGWPGAAGAQPGGLSRARFAQSLTVT